MRLVNPRPGGIAVAYQPASKQQRDDKSGCEENQSAEIDGGGDLFPGQSGLHFEHRARFRDRNGLAQNRDRSGYKTQKRTQSSIIVSTDSGNSGDCILFNASPDILTQLQTLPVTQPGQPASGGQSPTE